MPCWYFEKKEIKNSPSYRDGIDSGTEARYRKEGARFIVEAGTKLGLRYDTCATGVVYYHRFYMFHSFKDFPRYVTAACCLFLAGKVEETPKKCKDIIKIAQQLLKPKQFSVFGSDPKEEVMTVERVLLQTIKFDLQASHPYAYLLKYAKHLKADKEKTQKLVQMAWTFINDSLCTTLCLQWEPEIIAVSLMYLGTRLNKFEISDWTGRVPGAKQKWWETFVEDITVELMEDVCHQVLDLYSQGSQQATETGESPPPPPPHMQSSAFKNSSSANNSDRKRSLQSTPSDPVTPGAQSNKSLKVDSRMSTPQKNTDKDPTASRAASKTPVKAESKSAPQVAVASSGGAVSQDPNSNTPGGQQSAAAYGQTPSSQYPASSTDFTQYNPYMSSKQYVSSFMSQEGVQNIQTMMGTQAGTAGTNAAPQYSSYTQPPPPVAAPPIGTPQPASQYGQFPPGYNPAQYPASAAPPGPPIQPFSQPPPNPASQQFTGTAYPQYPPYSSYQQPPPQQQQQQQQGAPAYTAPPYSQSQMGPRPRHAPSGPGHRQPHQPRQGASALTTVRITGR